MTRDLTERIEKALTGSPQVKRFAGAIQKGVNGLGASPWLRPLKNLLNGTWLGHPLHPVLTDVTAHNFFAETVL
jgi:hypothetical protein